MANDAQVAMIIPDEDIVVLRTGDDFAVGLVEVELIVLIAKDGD